jgi:hypothetical protein
LALPSSALHFALSHILIIKCALYKVLQSIKGCAGFIHRALELANKNGPPSALELLQSTFISL